jgi:acyl carrier protein
MLIERIKPVIDNHFIYEGDLTIHTKVIDDLGADSFDIPVLINALEDHFGISILSEEIMGLRTIGDLLEIIQIKLSEEDKNAG